MDTSVIALGVIGLILVIGIVVLVRNVGRLTNSLTGDDGGKVDGQELATLRERITARDDELAKLKGELEGITTG